MYRGAVVFGEVLAGMACGIGTGRVGIGGIVPAGTPVREHCDAVDGVTRAGPVADAETLAATGGLGGEADTPSFASGDAFGGATRDGPRATSETPLAT